MRRDRDGQAAADCGAEAAAQREAAEIIAASIREAGADIAGAISNLAMAIEALATVMAAKGI